MLKQVNTKQYFLHLHDCMNLRVKQKWSKEKTIKFQFLTKPKFYHKIYNNSKQRWLDLTLRSSVDL